MSPDYWNRLLRKNYLPRSSNLLLHRWYKVLPLQTRGSSFPFPTTSYSIFTRLHAFPAAPAKLPRQENYYSIIEVTTPAPTVLPPSRMAKRRPASMAIGVMSPISMFTLSPGMTISTPSGSCTEPVTSVVRK
jgi:hypothetical protein